MKRIASLICAGLLAALVLIVLSPTARAGGIQQTVTQIGTPDNSILASASSAVSAGVTANAAIGGTAGRYTCVTQVKVHLANVSAAVAGDVTLSDGSRTIHMQCVDTTSFGAYCIESYQPPLQSTATGGTWTATVPALSGGGAGDVFVNGYTRVGGC